MYSWRLFEWHFWLALAGIVIMILAIWNSGIVQGLMWRTYTDAGTLRYSFVDSMEAMYPYHVARVLAGALFLLGAIICLYNVWMTIRWVPRRSPALDHPTSSEASEPAVPAE